MPPLPPRITLPYMNVLLEFLDALLALLELTLLLR